MVNVKRSAPLGALVMAKIWFVAVLSVLALLPLRSDDNMTLEDITVTDESENGADSKIGEVRKSAKDLSKQQVSDTRDLVRYETGVSVVETGRFGASGYSVRGVDENRVAIMIDGLQQAETLSSQGFKELFEGYGNFNNTRNGVEVETLREAVIKKGADSIKTGSGSLGGSVSFESKDARDFLLEKDWHLGSKLGFQSADNQFYHSHTLAGRYKMFDALFIKTLRRGNELQNYGWRDYNASVVGVEREVADPYEIKRDSTYFKLGFSPNENNRFTFLYDNSKMRSRGHDYSYSFTFGTVHKLTETGKRYTDDESKRRNIAFSYENFSQTPLWDTLKLSYAQQDITTRARTDEQCRGNNCAEIQNKEGYKVKNNTVVTSKGALPYKFFKRSGAIWLKDEKGREIPYTSTNLDLKRLDELWFDCSVFDCSKGIRGYDISAGEEKTFALTKRYTDPRTGKTYGHMGVENANAKGLWPKQPGFLTRDWKKRDLDTNTRQFNLDLSRELSLGQMQHDVFYGGLISVQEKQMVNFSGYDARQAQWWAQAVQSDHAGNVDNCLSGNALSCPHDEPKMSFLIPVKTQTRMLYFTDEWRINNFVSLDLGLRLDGITYRPEYIPGKTAKIPDDMVKGLYVPLPSAPAGETAEQKKAREAKNAQENLQRIAQKKSFSNYSYALSAKLDPLSYLRLQFKFANGFRAPTADEMYLAFRHPDFTIIPNVELKPEKAQTKEAALTLHKARSFITLSLFKTSYRDFLDLKYIGSQDVDIGGQGNSVVAPFYKYRNVNRTKAYAQGYEMNSRLDLGQLWRAARGFSLSCKLTHQKGRINGDGGKELAMNAIQPRTAVYGLGYSSAKDTFGADLYFTSVAAKAAEDTYDMFYKEKGKSHHYSDIRSKAYHLMDLIAYAKPLKGLTLRAGAYNITDVKYLTWEGARSVKYFGTTNKINNTTLKGLNRFYAPGRNYKLSAELVF
ncbi:MAG: TonB-dependent hemoglobin/transferrin/lactoferrin family receptor [Helicobacteraceae bacterium]